jgi:hypothetical protein
VLLFVQQVEVVVMEGVLYLVQLSVELAVLDVHHNILNQVDLADVVLVHPVPLDAAGIHGILECLEEVEELED